ncbi:MAG: hypothetical protein WD995_04325 [Gemmatimonadota bacterium]
MTQRPEAQSGEIAVDREALRPMYEAYRRRQARRLVSMLPRESIRPLYRAVLDARSVDDGAPGDPLEALVAHCATLLPLPPFPVWAADLARFPDAHLRDLDDSAEGPSPAEPLALAARMVDCGGVTWTARLHVFRADGAWRGFIAFEGPSLGDTCRTAVVFRESTPEELRARFLAFEAVALGAFLRSSLP